MPPKVNTPKLNTRTAVLAIVALLLVGVTVYDYTRSPGTGSSGEELEPATAGRQAGGRMDRVTMLAREAAELKYFLAHASQVRARYKVIAVPYAESVATFATLYPAGENPAEIAKKRIAGLLPKNVEMSDLLIAQTSVNEKGATWLSATLVLSGSDSDAFEQAVLTLGDAANGTIWKGITVAGDAEHRTLRASGQLSLLMIEQVE
jgi:hypothetical protein